MPFGALLEAAWNRDVGVGDLCAAWLASVSLLFYRNLFMEYSAFWVFITLGSLLYDFK